jgi:hypothetical protein
MHLSYSIGALRCFPAFLLYASFIRNQNGAADTARGPSGCLHPDGPGSTANGVEELASAQTAGTAQTSKTPMKWASNTSMVLKSQTAETAQTSKAAQPIGGAISKGYLDCTPRVRQ